MTGKFLTQDANLFFSLSGLTSLFSDAIVISDGEWEEIPIEELTCKTPVPLDDLSKINRAVENLKKEGVQPYPGSDNFYPTTPPSTSRTVLHSYQPSHTVRSHGNASVKAVRYRTITPQTILEAEQRPTAYAPPISQPPPPPTPSHARTDEQHPTAASISPPTPPPPPPPPPSPAQEQSDSDSETAERGPEQPAGENICNSHISSFIIHSYMLLFLWDHVILSCTSS
ncbi:uncharacterized protein [Nothobranchius furzeri]|uniref:uncharacterized protein n=1 Tax=Nothobranchius furzeri TaxID=105023 RepID=UPI003904A824